MQYTLSLHIFICQFYLNLKKKRERFREQNHQEMVIYAMWGLRERKKYKIKLNFLTVETVISEMVDFSVWAAIKLRSLMVKTLPTVPFASLSSPESDPLLHRLLYLHRE